MEPMILASGSPRRQDFFKLLRLPFICIPAMIDETPVPGLSPEAFACDLALRKVQSVKDKNPDAKWIFGADTIVVLDEKIYGKPENRDCGREMLKSLTGKRHKVITAMALYNNINKKTDIRHKASDVDMAPLSDAEIEWYLDTGEWQGAAGAYRLQELGACLISSINGSPSGIAGLPLHDFYAMLRENGYNFPLPYGDEI